MSSMCKVVCVILAAALLASGSRAADRATLATPARLDDGWEVGSPGDFGADASLLESLVDLITMGEYPNTHSVLVVKGGVLVVEEYFEGHTRDELHEIRSATKSIGSMLMGIAIDRGFIESEGEPIYTFFEGDYQPAGGWSDFSRRVEIRHLLSMMSGYDCDDLSSGFACEHAMHASEDWIQFSLDLPFAHDPGESWAYNSSSLILVGEAIAKASGFELDAFAERYLFGPLGVRGFEWLYSPRGNAWIGGGARTTPREMAKFGQLMLNRGVWKGERILSERWIAASTRKQGEMLLGVDYGYLWQSAPAYIGRNRVTAYWASGNGGQYIVVLPEESLAVVFTGGNYDSPVASEPFRMLTHYIIPAFTRPDPLEEVRLSRQEIDQLTGVYHLDFEHAATSTIDTDGDGVRLLSPDGELIELVAHSPTFFTGDSRYGQIAVEFETDDTSAVVKHTVYGSFQRFAFERQ